MSDKTDSQVYFRERRKLAGLTQGEAAAKMGFSRNYLSELERGKDYNSRVLRAMAEAYECTVADLFRDPDAPGTKWASIYSRIPKDKREQAERTAESFAEEQKPFLGDR